MVMVGRENIDHEEEEGRLSANASDFYCWQMQRKDADDLFVAFLEESSSIGRRKGNVQLSV